MIYELLFLPTILICFNGITVAIKMTRAQ